MENLGDLTIEQLKEEVKKGGRFVIFEYCYSVIFFTKKSGTDIYFIRQDENHLRHALPYILSTLVLGWWGFPWGIVYTIQALYTNIKGGKDVTDLVMNSLGQQYSTNNNNNSNTSNTQKSKEDYKHLYYDLLKKYHPDHASSNVDKEFRNDITKKIIEAYNSGNYQILELFK